MTEAHQEPRMATAIDKALYSPDEAAAWLDISRAGVYNLLRTGRLRSVKIGAHRKILRESLVEFVDSLVKAS